MYDLTTLSSKFKDRAPANLFANRRWNFERANIPSRGSRERLGQRQGRELKRESTRIRTHRVKSGRQWSRSRVNRIVIFRSRGERRTRVNSPPRYTYTHTRKTRINLNFKHCPRETGRADGTKRARTKERRKGERTRRRFAAKIAIFAPTRSSFSRANITIVPVWKSAGDPSLRYEPI